MSRVLSESLTPPQSRGLGLLRVLASFALRLLGRVTLAVWFGGFTFYAAVVVPDLHENLGGMETGEISRRVAPFLYATGAAALALAWLDFLTDRYQRNGWRGKARLGLLAANSLLLITLILMHRSLGIYLDSGGKLAEFRAFHEVYLTIWTVQWLAILGLMAIDAFQTIPTATEALGLGSRCQK
jgi:hypothetical protein